MRLLLKLIGAIVFNAIALYAAIRYIPGFSIAGGTIALIKIAIALTALNLLLRPLLKIILGPLILITFGFGVIFVNMIVLYALDKLSDNLTIEGILALLYGAILVGIVNFIYHRITSA